MDLATAAQYRSSFLLSTVAHAPGSPPPLPPQLTSTTSSSLAPPPAMLGGKSLSFSQLVLHEGRGWDEGGAGGSDVEEETKVVRAAWSPRRGDASDVEDDLGTQVVRRRGALGTTTDLRTLGRRCGRREAIRPAVVARWEAIEPMVLASRMPSRWRRHECGNALVMEATGREWEWVGTGES